MYLVKADMNRKLPATLRPQDFHGAQSMLPSTVAIAVLIILLLEKRFFGFVFTCLDVNEETKQCVPQLISSAVVTAAAECNLC